MMSNVYELQIAVNADLFYQFYKKHPNKVEYKKTFYLDWKMFKGEEPTAEALDQFHL